MRALLATWAVSHKAQNKERMNVSYVLAETFNEAHELFDATRPDHTIMGIVRCEDQEANNAN